MAKQKISSAYVMAKWRAFSHQDKMSFNRFKTSVFRVGYGVKSDKLTHSESIDFDMVQEYLGSELK